MIRPLRATLIATAIVLGLGAEAGAQYGPNNPNPPSLSGITVMRPDFTMRPPRSFRDPVPAGRTAQTTNPFEDFWSGFLASASRYHRQASASVVVSTPRTAKRRHARRPER
jgi:hypothetical protein